MVKSSSLILTVHSNWRLKRFPRGVDPRAFPEGRCKALHHLTPHAPPDNLTFAEGCIVSLGFADGLSQCWAVPGGKTALFLIHCPRADLRVDVRAFTRHDRREMCVVEKPLHATECARI